MEYEIINRYRDAGILNEPTAAKPFETPFFINSLREAAHDVLPAHEHRVELSRNLTAIGMLARYLSSVVSDTVVPDELLLEQFGAGKFASGNGIPYSVHTLNSAVDDIRRLLNTYFYAKRMIRRTLLSRRTYRKYRRFLGLTQTTQELIVQFEEDGRHVRSRRRFVQDLKTGQEVYRINIERKLSRLTEYNRKSCIDKTFTVLSVIKKDGIEKLSKQNLDDYVQAYRKENRLDGALSNLSGLYSLVANGIALGILKYNPFDEFAFERRRLKVKLDFVMPEGMRKLLDLKSLNWNDHNAVRGRCIATLIYDTGLRGSAISLLTVNDIKELPDGRFQINVRGKYLKGYKEDMTMHILFQQTIPLLRYWLHRARPSFHPKTDRLFVSTIGEPLTRYGVRQLVRDCCDQCGVSTMKGRIPSPHTLRHTLATLNIEPYGKSLPVRLMQERLIHVDYKTLMTNYVHHNPLSEMQEYKKLLHKDSRGAFLTRISQEDFFGLLDSLTLAKPSSIKEVKRAYHREMEKYSQDETSPDECTFIDEAETLRILSVYEFEYRSFRLWAVNQGICRITNTNDTGVKQYHYKEDVVKRIKEEYLDLKDALSKFSGSRSLFYSRLKVCDRIKIGNKCLVLKNDFLQHILANPRNADQGYAKYKNRVPKCLVG